MVVIRYGFSEMHLNRIEACPFSANAPSMRLLDRLGFRLEGNLRQRTFFREKYYDQLYFGLLKGEWEKNSVTHPHD